MITPRKVWSGEGTLLLATTKRDASTGKLNIPGGYGTLWVTDGLEMPTLKFV